jgi:hypothetical protein
LSSCTSCYSFGHIVCSISSYVATCIL